MTNVTGGIDPRRRLYYEASQKCRSLIDMLIQLEGLCERGMRDTIDPMQEHTDRTVNGMLRSALALSERFFFAAHRAATGALLEAEHGAPTDKGNQPAPQGDRGREGKPATGGKR